MSRWKLGVRALLAMALMGSVVMMAAVPAGAASSHLIVHRGDRGIAGEVWFNSGYSAGHEGHPGYGENSFTIKDRSCGDGWGVGVRWELNGRTGNKSIGDCKPSQEITFPSNLRVDVATEFRWQAFAWDTSGVSASTHEPWPFDWIKDWIGVHKSCDGPYVEEAATYGSIADGVGHTFEVTMWPTPLARGAGDLSVPSMWKSLRECITFPSTVTEEQIESMRQQLVCHVRFAKLPIRGFGGKTWDLEAGRGTISQWDMLDPRAIRSHKCNW